MTRVSYSKEKKLSNLLYDNIKTRLFFAQFFYIEEKSDVKERENAFWFLEEKFSFGFKSPYNRLHLWPGANVFVRKSNLSGKTALSSDANEIQTQFFSRANKHPREEILSTTVCKNI